MVDSALCFAVLDGNIAAGKTSLGRELQRRGYAVHFEDVEGWGDTLTRFYRDPGRWSYLLQTRILLSMHAARARARATAEAGGRPVVFFERSPQSSLLFVEEAVAAGHMDACEHRAFLDLHAVLGWTPDRVLWVDTPPSVCAERMARRGRAAEADVDVAYLERLDARHREAIVTGRLGGSTERLDGTLSIAQLADEVVRLVGGAEGGET